MRKLLFYTVTLLCAICILDSCKENEGVESLPPEISIKQPKVFPASGGKQSIPYTINNLLEGVMLEADTQTDWITDLSVNEKSVSFRISENKSTKERQGSITLYYQEAESVSVKIKQEGISTTSLDKNGTANCYIISEPGTYQFPAVKGNSDKPAGPVSSVEVLWETFGTDTASEKGDLIQKVSYASNMIIFTTAAEFKKGNALIAARDESGKILWSWHIWFTDKPEEQVYLNDAGTMMDRNLGATSATPGEAGALGLLYQWGRKDPFLSSSKITGRSAAKATIDFNLAKSDASTGTIDYAIANPTTFITSNNSDWYYFEGNEGKDNSRWTRNKTIYDPCPPGYRVPDGGSDGVWSKALNWDLTSRITNNMYDITNIGSNFCSSKGSNAFSDAENCWYPMVGRRDQSGNIALNNPTTYWACSPSASGSTLLITDKILVLTFQHMTVTGNPVRCQKEQ